MPADPERMLLPYQEKWRSDRSRLKLAEKSRQIGWTWTDALDSMEQAAAGVCDVWISSRDELQAKLYLDDCSFWASHYAKGAEVLGLKEVIGDSGSKHSAYVMRFPQGSSINSLSSNPDAQAGKRGTRKLDEFALHKDPKLLYEIAYPGITWGGQLAIFSTHRGSQNFFNRLIREIVEKDNPKGISHHRVTLQDALDEGLLFKLQQRLPDGDPRQEMTEEDYFDFIRSACTDEESFLQEYMCVPADDASAFLPYDLIDSCTYAAEENLVEEIVSDGKGSIRILKHPDDQLGQLSSTGQFFAGYDVGRKKDLSVLWVIERVGGVMLTRLVMEFDRITFSRQEEFIYPYFNLCRRSCIDATGLGMQLAETAQLRFGDYRIEQVNFTAPVKEELAYPLRSAFEDRSLRIPFDEKVTSDLRMIRKETTAAGNIRFTAEGEGDSHADRFWALALAIHAGKNPTGPFRLAPISVPRHERRDHYLNQRARR
ncbi:MAG: terminase family protein [Verrucomicrobiota bacterium]